MPQPQHRSSQLKLFLVIYLVIFVAVGSAIYFLHQEQKKELLAQATMAELMAPDDRIKETPSPQVAKSKPKSKPPAKKAKPKPEKQDDPKPVASKNEPEKPVVTILPKEKEEETKPSLSPEEVKEIEALYPFREIKPLMEIVNNWEDVPKKAFPKLVAIRKPIDFKVSDKGKVVAIGKLPVGSMMTPLTLQGDRIFLTSASAVPIQATVPVGDTDFKELIQKRYNRFVDKTRATTLAQRKAEQDRRLGAVALEKELAGWNPGTDLRFAPMKASLQKGEVSTYSLLDAAKWRWGGTEKIDGMEYQTAFVLIISEAAFGVTERELKVLLSDGKIVRWMDAATGETI